jgi:hypothetical protein
MPVPEISGRVRVVAAYAVVRLPAMVNRALLTTLSADGEMAVADIARKALG